MVVQYDEVVFFFAINLTFHPSFLKLYKSIHYKPISSLLDISLCGYVMGYAEIMKGFIENILSVSSYFILRILQLQKVQKEKISINSISININI